MRGSEEGVLGLVLLLLVLRRPVGGGSTILLSLQGCTLGGTSRGLLEAGVRTESAEYLAGSEVHVHARDVVGGEVLQAHGTAGGDAGRQRAEFANHDAVALEQDLADAGAQLDEHALHDGTGIEAVVVADVLAEVLRAVLTRELDAGIRLLRVTLVERIGSQGDAVLNLFSCHSVFRVPTPTPPLWHRRTSVALNAPVGFVFRWCKGTAFP